MDVLLETALFMELIYSTLGAHLSSQRNPLSATIQAAHCFAPSNKTVTQPMYPTKNINQPLVGDPHSVSLLPLLLN
jgi:hypothetical protein